MTQAFNTVQSTITPKKGSYALIPNIPHGHDYIFYSAQNTDEANFGDFVKLSTTSTNVNDPVVEACQLTDVPFGMVVYNVLVDNYAVGDKLALAQSGDQVWLVANAAIAVGKKLQMAAGGYVDATETEGNAFIGYALTNATAQGDMVKVQLDFNLGTQPTAE